jgi:hypothetical protein
MMTGFSNGLHQKVQASTQPTRGNSPMTSPSYIDKPGFGQLRWRAVILALTAALTVIVVSVAEKLSAPAKHPHAAAAVVSGQAEAKAARPVTKPIVPAKAIDPDSAAFIGTGDGSAGYWTGP